MGSGGYKINDQYAIYFLTFTIVGWVDLFTRRQCKEVVIESLRYCQTHKGLLLYAFVLMESHLHLIASAKPETTGLSGLIRDFKRHTASEIISWITDNKYESRKDWLDIVFRYYGKYNSNNEVYQVWKQNNRHKICISSNFTRQKLNYIHNNPVKSRIVDHRCDYVFSSARNYAQRDDYILEVEILDLSKSLPGRLKV